MKIAGVVATAFFVAACVGDKEAPFSQAPQPAEIIDLGTLLTETTPEEFWGRGFMRQMNFADSNQFEVIHWNFGPIDGSNSYYRLFNHGGPHIDAPSHVGLGHGLDGYAIESFAGPLKVFDFSHLDIGRVITADMVSETNIRQGDVVLIYTGYSAPVDESSWPAAVALTFEAAEYLAELPVRAFGTDAFNVESMTDDSAVQTEIEFAKILPGHYAFLSRGIPVYEQLSNVEQLVDKSNMYFVGVPINVKNGDGMVVRPVALVY